MNSDYYSPNIPVDCWSKFYICSLQDVDCVLSYCRLYFCDRLDNMYVMFYGRDNRNEIHKHGFSITFMSEVDSINSINSATNTQFHLIKSTASIKTLYITYDIVKEFDVFDDCVQEAHKLIMEYQL